LTYHKFADSLKKLSGFMETGAAVLVATHSRRSLFWWAVSDKKIENKGKKRPLAAVFGPQSVN
jgi:hypothetical protein